MARKKSDSTLQPSIDYSQMGGLLDELIPTGLLPLDTVLGGGYEAGDMISITSEPGTGKSTLFMTIAKNFINEGHRVAYFDSEKGVKKSILDNFGLTDIAGHDIENSQLFLIRPDTYINMEIAFKDCIAFGFKFIFIDSMTALVDSVATDELVSEKVTIGETARVESKLYPVIKSLAKVNKVTVFIVQQMRNRMENKRGIMNVVRDSAGGFAARHTPDIRLFMDKGPKYVEERIGVGGETEKVEFGNEARLWSEKNRNAPSFIKVPCPIIYGRGMKNSLYAEIIMRARGRIFTKGPHSYVKIKEEDEPKCIKGKNNVTKWVSDNLEEIIHEIEKERWSKIQAVEVE